MTKGIIALDADGVLLDYNLAYAGAWEKAFGVYPAERDPAAYSALDRWDVELLSGERLAQLRKSFQHDFWSSIPAMAGALEGCRLLSNAGFELVCITAMAGEFSEARLQNLQKHGFPIKTVHVIEHSDSDRSPKADLLDAIRPVAFVDDYLPYLLGVREDIHTALIMRGTSGPPNSGQNLRFVSSQHESLLAFAHWWISSDASHKAVCKP